MLRLFGTGYAAGQRVTVLLALVMLVATGCGMVDTVLNMAGRTSWTFYNALAGTAVNVLLNVLLIPRFGGMGAATAWAASILITNLVPLAQLYHAYRLHPFGRGTLTAAGLALACFGVPGLLAQTILDAGPVTLAALAALGAAGYAGAVWRLRRVLQLDALRALRRGRRR
jgi:O-antigen/teichoic acid export membrane protein